MNSSLRLAALGFFNRTTIRLLLALFGIHGSDLGLLVLSIEPLGCGWRDEEVEFVP